MPKFPSFSVSGECPEFLPKGVLFNFSPVSFSVHQLMQFTIFFLISTPNELVKQIWMKMPGKINSLRIGFTSLLLLMLSCSEGTGGKKQYGPKMPPFELIKLNGGFMNSKDLPAGKAVIFIYFETQCDHCKEEIKDISLEGGKLKDCEVILVSNEELDTLKKFYSLSTLNHFPFVHVTKDNEGKWAKYFKPVGSPVNFIYDSNHRLVKRINRMAKVSELVKLLPH